MPNRSVDEFEVELDFRDADGKKIKLEIGFDDGEISFEFKGRSASGDKIDIKVDMPGGLEAIAPFLSADRLFFAPLDDINGLGVEGTAFMAVSGETLTVLTAAEGVDAGLHVQHIHGFGGARDAVTPTLDDDADGDGFIELAEGLPRYGPIQIFLDPAPMPTDDEFLFVNSFDLSESAVSPDNLTDHEVVLHGADIAPGPGAGTDGEVNGENGYLTVLPVGAGEIAEIDTPAEFKREIETDTAKLKAEAKNGKSKLEFKGVDANGEKLEFKLEAKDGEVKFKLKGRDSNGEKVDIKAELDGGDIDAFLMADSLFYAVLDDLQGLGVEAAALMALNGNALTVLTAADGVDAGLHVQHIHGFGADMAAVTPTAEDDADGDGFIELGEGFPLYGPIQLALDPAPVPTEDEFLFIETFQLSDDAPLRPETLDFHEVVIHGADIPPGPGAGTGGEVNGENGYLAILPVAAGEIEMIEIA